MLSIWLWEESETREFLYGKRCLDPSPPDPGGFNADEVNQVEHLSSLSPANILWQAMVAAPKKSEQTCYIVAPGGHEFVYFVGVQADLAFVNLLMDFF